MLETKVLNLLQYLLQFGLFLINEAFTDLSVENSEVKNKHKGTFSVQLLVILKEG